MRQIAKVQSSKSNILIINFQDNMDCFPQEFTELFNISYAKASKALKLIREFSPDLIIINIESIQKSLKACKSICNNIIVHSIPVIFVTSYDDNEDIISGLNCGALDILVAPFNSDELISKVNNLVKYKMNCDLVCRENERLRTLNEEKSKIIAIGSHDLKNPLKVIHGFSKLIEENFSSFSQADILDFIKDIKSSSVFMMKILSDTLDLYNYHDDNVNINYDIIEIIELINNTISEKHTEAYQKNIHIKIKSSEKTIFINTDYIKLNQLLNNILTYSLKYSSFNKNIIIKIENPKAIPNEQQFLKIIISDEGPGIDIKEFTNIYNNLDNLKSISVGSEQATRLGIAIIHRLAEILGITLEIFSETGKQTSIVLLIPTNQNVFNYSLS